MLLCVPLCLCLEDDSVVKSAYCLSVSVWRMTLWLRAPIALAESFVFGSVPSILVVAQNHL